jgi:hypothetical protein
VNEKDRVIAKRKIVVALIVKARLVILLRFSMGTLFNSSDRFHEHYLPGLI